MLYSNLSYIPIDFTRKAHGMKMRALVFSLFFLWGIFWMGMDGFHTATASEGFMEKAQEVGPHRREADQIKNTAHAAPRYWKVSFEWDEPNPSAREIFEKMITTESRRNPFSFTLGAWEGIESEKRFTFLNEEERHLSNAGRYEPSKPQRDWRGIGRDTAFYMGYQVVFAGVLYFLPESVTSWTKDQKKATLSKWKENVQNPVWDKDKWWINYLGHPYFGATFYIRARERGFEELGSFGYSALLSALYEFGIEAFFEPPSYQDLIVTPVGGILIGKYIFEPIRENIKAKAQRKWYDHAGLFLTDPLGAVNSVFERALGIQSDIRVQFHSSPREQMAVAPPAGSFPEWKEVRFSGPDGVSIQLDVEWK